MKENDVKFFKTVAIFACLIICIGVGAYVAKNYHYETHQEQLDRQAKEMKDAIDSVNKELGIKK
jgi:hypothetical protein